MTPLLTLFIVVVVGVIASGIGKSRNEMPACESGVVTPLPVSVMAVHSIWLH